MTAQVQNWGNSPALRIPTELAAQIGLDVVSEVDLRVEHGCLKIYPAGAPRYTLEELVAEITPENRHAAADWGPPIGREGW